MLQSNLAVCWTLGVNLSATGPATSALNNWTPPKPNNGKIAILKTIIPIPPIKCVKLLQNNNPFGAVSIWNVFNMVAPVVVKPDIDSKKQFI